MLVMPLAATRIQLSSSAKADDPVSTGDYWIPAFAGMTTSVEELLAVISMPEMPDAGEHHGDAVIVGGLDDFVVAHRTAGLDHRGGAGFDRDQ